MSDALHVASLALATFASVFLLGFQSRTVNSGHYMLAFINSVLIGLANLTLFKLVPAVQTGSEFVAYILGGPLGIMCAIYVHERFLKRKPTNGG